MPTPKKKKGRVILSPVSIPKELDRFIRIKAIDDNCTIAAVIEEMLQSFKDRSEIP